MFGSYGPLPIKKATTLRQSLFLPVAEADVALGLPSLQDVSRRLEDLELSLSFFGGNAVEESLKWREIAKSEERSYLLIIGKKPQGKWLITAIVQEIGFAVDDDIRKIILNITFKEEGAFLWAGNYSPYEPPPTVRPSAEAGISGLSRGVLDWLKR